MKKAVFDQAKSKGVTGEGFDQVAVRLSLPSPKDGEQTSQEIIDKAIELREAGKYDKAIDLLLNKISQFPTDPDIPALLSQCYISNEDLEKAIIYLDKAKSINPDVPSVRWNEVRILLVQQKADDALALAQKANKLFPKDVEGMGVLGACLKASGNFDESLKYLNKAIKIKPNYAEALINRGLIRLAQKDKPSALSDLEKAHNLKPDIKQIWHLILNLKMDAKDFKNAILLAQRMIKTDPLDEKLLIGIAASYWHLNNYDQATVYYKKALSIRPGNAETYNNMGATLKDLGKLDEAIWAYNKAISLKSDYAEAFNNMGVAFKDQGKLPEAIDAYSNALSINPSFAEAYSNKGNALKYQGKLDER